VLIEVTRLLSWCGFDEYGYQPEDCAYHYECSPDGARDQPQYQQDDCPEQVGYESGAYDADCPDDYLRQRPNGAGEEAEKRDVTENADAHRKQVEQAEQKNDYSTYQHKYEAGVGDF
jgi:hypothetical protein